MWCDSSRWGAVQNLQTDVKRMRPHLAGAPRTGHRLAPRRGCQPETPWGRTTWTRCQVGQQAPDHAVAGGADLQGTRNEMFARWNTQPQVPCCSLVIPPAVLHHRHKAGPCTDSIPCHVCETLGNVWCAGERRIPSEHVLARRIEDNPKCVAWLLTRKQRGV